MPSSQSTGGSNSNSIMDGSELSQNADIMDFEDASGQVDQRPEKQLHHLLHVDFYDDFGDLFTDVTV